MIFFLILSTTPSQNKDKRFEKYIAKRIFLHSVKKENDGKIDNLPNEFILLLAMLSAKKSEN